MEVEGKETRGENENTCEGRENSFSERGLESVTGV